MGAPVVCGGNNGDSVLRECNSYVAASQVWSPFGNLMVAREFAASAITADGWWITGGMTTGNTILDTTEIYQDGLCMSNFKPNPDLTQMI